VRRIVIVFDEGQDAGRVPDQFGAAVLDNVDIMLCSSVAAATRTTTTRRQRGRWR
jgi:hypothetical protein